jgi:outer membrane protein
MLEFKGAKMIYPCKMFNFASAFLIQPMLRIWVIILLLLSAISAEAQRYCYVDTKYILENMPDYAQAQSELNRLSEKWQNEIVQRYEAIDNMRQAYQAERVLLTSDMKRQREEEIAQAEKEAKELQKKRFSLNGDLFKKREELIKPIQDDIYKALVELAESGNYMVIFDKSNESSIIFASPKYDKSDRVLRKLGIKPGSATDDDDDDDDVNDSDSSNPGNRMQPNGSNGNRPGSSANSIKKG